MKKANIYDYIKENPNEKKFLKKIYMECGNCDYFDSEYIYTNKKCYILTRECYAYKNIPSSIK
ncbi:hypothetical protein [Sulfurimonas sp.]|uniref:hypothetical protein n=1 Tax=Sulfurimonas sp. TaxID=2022749 RepID=UPI0025F2F39D|nr:hypothetical protein [Sulfurimonas sp.]